ncbi:hypothetical protein B0H13DRAFT_2153373, partial [Mycena leptocephala]
RCMSLLFFPCALFSAFFAFALLGLAMCYDCARRLQYRTPAPPSSWTALVLYLQHPPYYLSPTDIIHLASFPSLRLVEAGTSSA